MEEVKILTESAGRRFKQMYGATDEKPGKTDTKPNTKTRTHSLSEALNKRVI